jgi:hypothetical protein
MKGTIMTKNFRPVVKIVLIVATTVAANIAIDAAVTKLTKS